MGKRVVFVEPHLDRASDFLVQLIEIHLDVAWDFLVPSVSPVSVLPT